MDMHVMGLSLRPVFWVSLKFSFLSLSVGNACPAYFDVAEIRYFLSPETDLDARELVQVLLRNATLRGSSVRARWHTLACVLRGEYMDDGFGSARGVASTQQKPSVLETSNRKQANPLVKYHNHMKFAQPSLCMAAVKIYIEADSP
ncbi:uncharacterized protein CIMG_05948 [Coccidioides immitis RS]|uniref:Uncharacterized protein n=3 Tax=Coccidioides immitis TaxID=5501 RepID=J3K741_COCIM|nr:uncharacterized protein CIMG_05948 [Coccidioides immitis RS]EAS30469.3 hypothetical protein CIMG_05948 [Coccidioides immitis RS]KMP03007.1 hypothetical protein CIRG_02699 [Coccidioides immitis RMSCC 2394]KMU90618.1 hypothetical protein CIHG_08429 [Coccidioides immitis H538.4]